MNSALQILTNPAAKTNYQFTRHGKFLLLEDRIFLRLLKPTRGEHQTMIAVIFEVWIDPRHKQNYLDQAARLKVLLEDIDGFISVERFQSLIEPDKILSLSFFRDEEAVKAWRNTVEHRAAQALGRGGYFLDYQLRITHVLRDYGMKNREQAPDDSKRVHPD
jgi:heme-degrading monooxygenase HmoA